MQQDIEITLIGMNEIAQEGLKRILTSENFAVHSMNFRDIYEASPVLDSDIADRPRIFIIDSSLGSVSDDVLEICGKVHLLYPDGRVVVLADGYEYDEVAKAFSSGVDGYILKAISCEPLFGLLRLIALGEKVLPSQLAESLNRRHPLAINDDWGASVRAVTLSSREVEVLACLSLGMANKVISRRHNITEATVKVHVKAILRKLHVANRTQAAIWAVQHGLDTEQQFGSDIPSLCEDDVEDTDGDIAQVWGVPDPAADMRSAPHGLIEMNRHNGFAPLGPSGQRIPS